MSKAMQKKFSTTINKVVRLSLVDKYSKAYGNTMMEFQKLVHRMEVKA